MRADAQGDRVSFVHVHISGSLGDTLLCKQSGSAALSPWAGDLRHGEASLRLRTSPDVTVKVLPAVSGGPIWTNLRI